MNRDQEIQQDLERQWAKEERANEGTDKGCTLSLIDTATNTVLVSFRVGDFPLGAPSVTTARTVKMGEPHETRDKEIRRYLARQRLDRGRPPQT